MKVEFEDLCQVMKIVIGKYSYKLCKDLVKEKVIEKLLLLFLSMYNLFIGIHETGGSGLVFAGFGHLRRCQPYWLGPVEPKTKPKPPVS